LNKEILYVIAIFSVAQCIVWFQLNLQFFWDDFTKYIIPISFIVGGIASYLFINGYRLCYEAFDGKVWPSRILGFSSGIIIFAFLTWFVLGEGITFKVGVCLFLAFIIILVQIFL